MRQWHLVLNAEIREFAENGLLSPQNGQKKIIKKTKNLFLLNWKHSKSHDIEISIIYVEAFLCVVKFDWFPKFHIDFHKIDIVRFNVTHLVRVISFNLSYYVISYYMYNIAFYFYFLRISIVSPIHIHESEIERRDSGLRNLELKNK